MITLEMMQERLANLQEERDQLQKNLYAYDGAIQDCQYWIGQLEQMAKRADWTTNRSDEIGANE